MVKVIHRELLEEIAALLKAMGDPTRLKILFTLKAGPKCVKEILKEVGGSQANVSKHLGILRRAGLVTAKRCGVNVNYSIADERVFTICSNVCDALKARIEQQKASLPHMGDSLEQLLS